MEKLFIVVYWNKDRWRLWSDGIFTERRLADNYAEIAQINDTNPKYDFFVVECPSPRATLALIDVTQPITATVNQPQSEEWNRPVKSYEEPLRGQHESANA